MEFAELLKLIELQSDGLACSIKLFNQGFETLDNVKTKMRLLKDSLDRLIK